MNWEQIEGKWDQVIGTFQKKWGKLTDNDWEQIKGKRTELEGKIKERNGVKKEEAEKQVRDFEKTLQ